LVDIYAARKIRMFPGTSPVLRYTFANSAAAENGFDKHAFASTKIAISEIFPGPNSTLWYFEPKETELENERLQPNFYDPRCSFNHWQRIYARIQYLR
jgi:hypothetical protein